MGSTQGTYDRIGGWGLFTLMADALAVGWREPAPRDGSVSVQEPERLPAAGWLDRIDHWFWLQQQRDRERYLAQAKDVFDLEVRIRDLERGSARGFY
jgi:hypothetical protein